MLKLAVIGAQTLLGRELVASLEAFECSVVPLTTGPLTIEQETGDLVVFAPTPKLLEGLDVVVLVDTPQDPELLSAFQGRLLDLREDRPAGMGEPIPLAGGWPAGKKHLVGRPAVELMLSLLPRLVGGMGDISGTHLRSVSRHGDVGTEGLAAQSKALLTGAEPDLDKLTYRQAFEVRTESVRGHWVTLDAPVFHGDLLVLHIHAAPGQVLTKLEAPRGVHWVEKAPTSREAGESPDMMAYLAVQPDGQRGTLILGFDPILWGALRPVMRVLELTD